MDLLHTGLKGDPFVVLPRFIPPSSRFAPSMLPQAPLGESLQMLVLTSWLVLFALFAVKQVAEVFGPWPRPRKIMALTPPWAVIRSIVLDACLSCRRSRGRGLPRSSAVSSLGLRSSSLRMGSSTATGGTAGTSACPACSAASASGISAACNSASCTASMSSSSSSSSSCTSSCSSTCSCITSPGSPCAPPAAPLTVPRHVAVIMDGNRRYGKRKYGGAGSRGHWDGGRTLVDFVDWCMAAGVHTLTAYAFSTENWKRDPKEIDVLFTIFETYCHQIHGEALSKGIRLRVLVSDPEKLPVHMRALFATMEESTQHCKAFELNLCVSYGSRSEIVQACRSISEDVAGGRLRAADIDEDTVSRALLTGGLEGGDPDLLIRTSGEQRLSNFLLYQLAYTEMIFVDKMWPELTEGDVGAIVQEFSDRKRRFGK